MNDSFANSRGAMGPPQMGSIKHKPTGRKIAIQYELDNLLTDAVPEPPSKTRRTLADRAGEPHNSKLAGPSASRALNSAVRAANGTRGLSASTSRVPSTNPRQPSAPSYGASVGSGRPPIASGNISRSKSVHGGGHARSKSQHQGRRPATSMAYHDEDSRPERKGVQPFLISTNPKESQDSLLVSKNASRTGDIRIYSDHGQPSRKESYAIWDRSFSSPHSRILPGSTPQCPTDDECDNVCDRFGALKLGAPTDETDSQRIGRGMPCGKNLALPSKSSIPRATPVRQRVPTQVHTNTPTRNPGLLTPSKPKHTPRFLNRFTNELAPVFDDSRVAAIERDFMAFKEKVEGDMSQQNDLKDTIKVLQSRGMFVIDFLH